MTAKHVMPFVALLVLAGAICIGLRFHARHGSVQRALAEGLPEVQPDSPVPRWRSRLAARVPLEILDLTRLPLGLRQVLSVILLMPFGALITCVFRNIIGIQTSGRFTPMLVAVNFVFADWRTGLAVLAAVVVLGLTTRNLLDRLKLLMLPRLSVILTLVVCSIVFAVSLLDYFHVAPGVHAVLLPMVILTMIIERFYVTGQEDGIGVAVQRLLGTLLVGLFCYLVFCWRAVAHLLLAYPEGHFFTVALLIVIGRYAGYQLFEWWRFRDAVEGQY